MTKDQTVLLFLQSHDEHLAMPVCSNINRNQAKRRLPIFHRLFCSKTPVDKQHCSDHRAPRFLKTECPENTASTPRVEKLHKSWPDISSSWPNITAGCSWCYNITRHACNVVYKLHPQTVDAYRVGKCFRLLLAVAILSLVYLTGVTYVQWCFYKRTSSSASIQRCTLWLSISNAMINVKCHVIYFKVHLLLQWSLGMIHLSWSFIEMCRSVHHSDKTETAGTRLKCESENIDITSTRWLDGMS